MLSIKNINKSYGDKKIIEDLNFDICPNKINSIVGKSGCGKTSLLNIISGLDSNFTGDIEDIKGKKLSYVFQEPRLIEYLSVYENLLLVCHDRDSRQNTDIFLKDTGIYEFRNFFPKNLSGGMKQKVNIIRAFLNSPEIIIMDEPFKSMDILSIIEINNIITKLRSRFSPTVILAEHNLEFVHMISDYVNVFSKDEKKITKTLKNTKDMDKNQFTNTISKLI